MKTGLEWLICPHVVIMHDLLNLFRTLSSQLLQRSTIEIFGRENTALQGWQGTG
jgi:hypothetical protein